MIKDKLIPKLLARFSLRGLRVGSPPEPIAIFPAIHPAVGDVMIYDDGDEATVVIDKITHGHFNTYDDKLTEEQRDTWISDEVTKFLEDLFSNKVLLWISESGKSGGWRILQDVVEPISKEDNAGYFFWSGPVKKKHK